MTRRKRKGWKRRKMREERRKGLRTKVEGHRQCVRDKGGEEEGE